MKLLKPTIAYDNILYGWTKSIIYKEKIKLKIVTEMNNLS
jgi:hypothetical protein